MVPQSQCPVTRGRALWGGVETAGRAFAWLWRDDALFDFGVRGSRPAWLHGCRFEGEQVEIAHNRFDDLSSTWNGLAPDGLVRGPGSASSTPSTRTA
ncbi:MULTISPECIES: hypothetical protein [unclassified Streptomyces]|uniref:hypothetical protein n=1 Tax=unclassified Streptomyces TaxID=2593676 RepID=UPI001BE9A9E4|nr:MULTISPECIES: hypothetical protein [unclassified Streptomyces]MBT2463116.1 hypothetical protein [Streptomyces sp. ISL-63]